ncbi:SUKH-3 domain-containing protein [Solwaraspora sp. WMMD792]|uniref:SUKH-3 domain-containing protein n=1 Tax=Solwaraspora sp. WMMD792 TaxID=3016099 RepID=UPI002416CCB2|nr:SUKH-3 domain-containing protein [Solwaraspora sp. WMMD792]MDG4773760.1 SUKH-3 domain-containing protein [Solwaraspora sp. WMMD792]
MLGRDEALDLARQWATEHGADAGTDERIGLHEFEYGYVAWLIPTDDAGSRTAGPPSAGPPDEAPSPAGSPTGSGSPRIVIDGESGEVSQWPPVPVTVVAERYAAARAADRRFPPDVRPVLEAAGWFPGRDVSAMVDQWAGRWAAELDGLVMTPVARAALTEFGGLTIAQFGSDGTADAGFPTFVHPVRSGLVTEEARVFVDEYDHPVFPLGGNSDGPAELVVDAAGRVLLLHWAGYQYVADDVDTALIRLVRGGPFPPLRPEQLAAGVSR